MGKFMKRLARWLGLSVAQDVIDEVQKRIDGEDQKRIDGEKKKPPKD